MHPLPSASGTSLTPAVSFVSQLEDRIARARRSPVCYDNTGMHEFHDSPEYPAAVEQTLAGLSWMEALLGAHPRWAIIRKSFEHYADAYSGDSPEHIERRCFFLGDGKRRLFQLCELLEKDRQPATIERVVRSMESDLTWPGGLLPDPGDVLDRALDAARDSGRSTATPTPLEPSAPPMFLAHLSNVPPSLRARESIGPSPSLLARARVQKHFYDSSCETPAQFLIGPAYEPTRKELFLLLQRLRLLLPAAGPDQDVAAMVNQHAQAWVGDRHDFNEVRALLFGAGKELIELLCLALEDDPGPEAQAIACRRLREAFQARELRPENITAIGYALSEVADANAPDVEPLPVADDAVLAAILKQIGAPGLRQLRQRLIGSMDRLMTLLPAGMDPAVRGRLHAWGERWATPPDTFDRRHAEMLDGGYRVLTALADELAQLDAVGRMEVVVCCEQGLRDAGQGPNAVARLANVLLKAERVRSGEDNPQLEARRRRFEAWSLPQRVKGRLDVRAVEDGLQILGLHQPETVYDGPLPEIDPIRSNAAWQACLAQPGSPIDVHPLADVDNADLADALARLRARCDELIVTDMAALDVFADRWLGRAPSGAQEDMVGNLREFGVAALDRLIDRLGKPDDRAVKQATLSRMLTDLSTTRDPAALLLRYARYELPLAPTSAATQAELDRKRRAVVEREVRRSASTLLEEQDPAFVEQAVGQVCRRVLALLGIRAAEGDAHAPDMVAGLIDLSPQSLARLNEEVRKSAVRPQPGASAPVTPVVPASGTRAIVPSTAQSSAAATSGAAKTRMPVNPKLKRLVDDLAKFANQHSFDGEAMRNNLDRFVHGRPSGQPIDLVGNFAHFGPHLIAEEYQSLKRQHPVPFDDLEMLVFQLTVTDNPASTLLTRRRIGSGPPSSVEIAQAAAVETQVRRSAGDRLSSFPEPDRQRLVMQESRFLLDLLGIRYIDTGEYGPPGFHGLFHATTDNLVLLNDHCLNVMREVYEGRHPSTRS